MNGLLENHDRMIELLSSLTKCGAATWAASDEDGFVNCLIGDDLIAFELQDGDAKYVDASGEIEGITGRFRNVQYLWLNGCSSWEGIAGLVRNAPRDREAFYEMKRHIHSRAILVLEDQLSSARRAAQQNGEGGLPGSSSR